MNLPIKLFILPALGIALVLTGFLWCGDQLGAAWNGVKSDGTVSAMIKSGPKGMDLITGLKHELKFHRADGSLLEVDLTNHRTVAVRESGLATDSRGEEIVPDASMVSWVNRAVMSDAETIKRALLRENADKSNKRVIKIEKIEHAQGYFGMKEIPSSFQEVAGEVIPVFARKELRPLPERQVMTTSGVITGKAAVGQSKTLENYSRTHADNFLQYAKNDFAMYDSDFNTLFAPVFTYRDSGIAKVGLSDLVKKGGASLAFGLFSSCKVASVANKPDTVILLPNYSTLGSSAAPLLWFSSACEGFFSRWVYGFVLIGTGLSVVLAGIVVISLKLQPSRCFSRD